MSTTIISQFTWRILVWRCLDSARCFYADGAFNPFLRACHFSLLRRRK